MKGITLQRKMSAEARQLRKIARSFGKLGQAKMRNPRRDKFEGFVNGLPVRPARPYGADKAVGHASIIDQRRQSSLQLRQIRNGQRDRDDFNLSRDGRAIIV